MGCDRALGFTASATGQFTVHVEAYNGQGGIAVAVEAVGTALHRSPALVVDGSTHPLHVNCYFDTCSYGYMGGPVLEFDGDGFELRLDATAGIAYAFDVHSSSPVEVRLTVFTRGKRVPPLLDQHCRIRLARGTPPVPVTSLTWSTLAADRRHRLHQHEQCTVRRCRSIRADVRHPQYWHLGSAFDWPRAVSILFAMCPSGQMQLSLPLGPPCLAARCIGVSRVPAQT